MSLPSDATADVEEAAERLGRPARPSASNHLTLEQKGWMAAALVAFLGIVYGGPALTRLRAQPSLRQRSSRRADEMRRKVRKAGVRARKRVRRLGGGSIWR